MEEIHILIGMVTGLGVIMMYLHQGIMKRFEMSDQRNEAKFVLLQETVTDIDRRLCRLEGAFASKDCCMIKDSRHKEESI